MRSSPVSKKTIDGKTTFPTRSAGTTKTGISRVKCCTTRQGVSTKYAKYWRRRSEQWASKAGILVQWVGKARSRSRNFSKRACRSANRFKKTWNENQHWGLLFIIWEMMTERRLQASEKRAGGYGCWLMKKSGKTRLEQCSVLISLHSRISHLQLFQWDASF